jgi:uncharacterized protein (TIGR02145 family)
MQNTSILIIGLLMVVKSYGQVPNSMSFQAVVRNIEGELISNQQIQVKLSILKGSSSGTVVYSELHTPTTNNIGLFTLQLGEGTIVSGDFSAIDWGEDIYFLKRELDPDGGTNYVITGISQFLSVPYAFHSKVADTVKYAPDTSSTNELQNLSVSTSGDTLYISGSNYIIVPGISLANHTPLTDIDGNVYDTVHIGTQIWMKSNLKTTKYNDGADIPNVTDNGTWFALTTGARTYYNNDSSTYALIYGAWYNWFAVNTGKLCPSGWHVPTDEDWTILSNYLGGNSISGGKLKEIGYVYWDSPNEGATNESGFSALGAGFRGAVGDYNFIKQFADFWSSTERPGTIDVWGRSIRYNTRSIINATYGKHGGLSVRCLKD